MKPRTGNGYRGLYAIFGLAFFVVLGLLRGDSVITAHAQETLPTPTYDPLVEPPLPSNPTELELGRNLYWHWCMTCHGDRGQGLTDEWRAVWEEDHQNCWARGCHAGSMSGEVFVIPTIVPLIIGETHLVQFSTVQSLADYLKLTHPPQHPGTLNEEEYFAIAAYVFTQNDRSLATVTPAPTAIAQPPATQTPTQAPTLLPSETPTPAPTKPKEQPPKSPYSLLAILLVIASSGVLVWRSRKGRVGM